MRKEDLRKQVIVKQEFNEIAKRSSKETLSIRDALNYLAGTLSLQAPIFSEKSGLFGIEQSSKDEAIKFVNAIRETGFTKYMSKMTPELFKIGQANLGEESTLSIKNDSYDTFKVTFGSKKSADIIVKALRGEKPTEIEVKETNMKLVQLKPLSR